MAPVNLHLSDIEPIQPYKSNFEVDLSKLNFLSYRYNPRNLEGHVYGTRSLILHTLDQPCSRLQTHPQQVISCKHSEAVAVTNKLKDTLLAKGPSGNVLECCQQPGRTSKAQKHQAQASQVKAAKGEIRLEAMYGHPEFEQGCETDDDEAEAEDPNVNWDSFSATSAETKPDDDPVDVIPDFIMTYSIVALLEPVALNTQTNPPAGPASTNPKQETPKEQEQQANIQKQAQISHFEKASILYNGQFLLHQAIFLMEEDKRGPSRKFYQPGHEAELINSYTSQFNKAQDDLLLYMFIYFNIVDEQAVSMVCHAVPGAFWHWAEFHRSEIPLYFFPTPRSALSLLRVPSEVKKEKDYSMKWRDQPVFEVGTKESDAALTRMIKKVFENIKKHSPKRIEGATLYYD